MYIKMSENPSPVDTLISVPVCTVHGIGKGGITMSVRGRILGSEILHLNMLA